MVLGLALAPSSAAAGWSLWPFGNGDDSEPELTRSRPMSASADFWKADVEKAPSRPSIFARMSSGTQRFFSSTKQALSFGRDKKPAAVNRVGTHTTTKKKQKPESSSWLQPAEPEAPRTMKEWWELKRPDPL
jgi:hypothetical protein